MVRRNGKSDVDSPELDADHELPPAEDTDTPEDAKSASVSPQPVPEGEFDKLKAERDTLLDRLARLQAEFENARKRAAREQQEFREYALADAVKELLPHWTASNAPCRPAPEIRQNFAAESNSSTSSCRTRWLNWDCVPSRPRASLSIRIFTRRLKWWTPAKPRIIKCSTSCSEVTS